jgi:quinol monooxygenase YgiN
MISFIVRMEFAPDDRSELRTILEKLTAATRQEPCCVTYIPHFVAEEPCTVMIYEQYKDDAAAQFHRTTQHFADFAIGGLYQLMKQREVIELEAVS